LNAFLAVADAVEEAFPRLMVDGNDARVVGDAGPRPGAFEVVVCDSLDDGSGEADLEGARAKDAAFSALSRGRPPSALEIIEALERELSADDLGLTGDAPSGAGCG